MVSLLDIPPGSREAVSRGCRCDVIRNHFGKGKVDLKDGALVFFPNRFCPLHGDDRIEGE